MELRPKKAETVYSNQNASSKQYFLAIFYEKKLRTLHYYW
jgi:hypothetical protein